MHIYFCIGNTTWNYDELGPDVWYLTYPNCGGFRQSPLNIITSCTEHHKFQPFNFSSYYSTRYNFTLINNGHTIVATLQNQTQHNLLTLSGGDLSGVFLFQSFHIHWGQNAKQGFEIIKDKCVKNVTPLRLYKPLDEIRFPLLGYIMMN
ncbi:unnamed protein product [Didymodactylos carnosus]|uniref:carbonic anhydrase n=1 Tax=Didymodactylos carnosus TaxID=1234261 RepID=A0A8S2STG9_9BILA|nr:unnamed protein product [Didymodactylos carnosus]CAF4251639.1 unnamed protein product [Didymodactylos carnosus]